MVRVRRGCVVLDDAIPGVGADRAQCLARGGCSHRHFRELRECHRPVPFLVACCVCEMEGLGVEGQHGWGVADLRA